MKNIRYERRNVYFLNVIKKYNFNEVCYFDFFLSLCFFYVPFLIFKKRKKKNLKMQKNCDFL